MTSKLGYPRLKSLAQYRIWLNTCKLQRYAIRVLAFPKYKLIYNKHGLNELKTLRFTFMQITNFDFSYLQINVKDKALCGWGGVVFFADIFV